MESILRYIYSCNQCVFVAAYTVSCRCCYCAGLLLCWSVIVLVCYCAGLLLCWSVTVLVCYVNYSKKRCCDSTFTILIAHFVGYYKKLKKTYYKF